MTSLNNKSQASRTSKSAQDFVEFYTSVKELKVRPTNEDIVKFSKLFEDEITLDNMTRQQLVALCRLLELTPLGTVNFLRLQLELKVRQLKTDDRVIQREGLDNLNVQELQVCDDSNVNFFRWCYPLSLSSVEMTADAPKKTQVVVCPIGLIVSYPR